MKKIVLMFNLFATLLFSFSLPINQNIEEDYREYVESGIIKLGDKVITIETMVLTIRSADVKERQNFTEFDIVRKINLGKTKIKMTPQEFRNTFDNSILCSHSMTESKAWQKIKMTFTKYGIKMK